jgi:hypothetical protein
MIGKRKMEIRNSKSEIQKGEEKDPTLAKTRKDGAPKSVFRRWKSAQKEV